jgi:hypothetical protein
VTQQNEYANYKYQEKKKFQVFNKEGVTRKGIELIESSSLSLSLSLSPQTHTHTHTRELI